MNWPTCIFLSVLVIGISSCGIFVKEGTNYYDLQKAKVIAEKCPCMIK